ncbi:hypothetical protein L873DRAFT_742079 [Choiromyces venosus 120613-1]|uniref:Uncharacterized protein n=1 Tax=Choiromyces venosus 120613-1 TaxID=1336337 RepID=A0A3N4JRH7_9PEZI|nr:hypothetical protein L873DRAFT_742079 [Choiromyces venosus 120613-1]
MAGLAGLPTCRPDHGSEWQLGITALISCSLVHVRCSTLLYCTAYTDWYNLSNPSSHKLQVNHWGVGTVTVYLGRVCICVLLV